MPQKTRTKRATSVDVEVGHRIRLGRKKAGISQTDLANQIGLTFQQVQKYEKGSNRVAMGRLVQIASALNLPVSFFFDEQVRPDAGTDSPSTADLLSRPYVFTCAGF